jgi:hypothetical protein
MCVWDVGVWVWDSVCVCVCGTVGVWDSGWCSFMRRGQALWTGANMKIRVRGCGQLGGGVALAPASSQLLCLHSNVHVPPQSPFCAEVVESADAYVFAGAVWNE